MVLEIAISLIVGFALGFGVREWLSASLTARARGDAGLFEPSRNVRERIHA
jgi:hypothetical protein